MKKIFFLYLSICTLSLFAEEICTDGTCSKLPSSYAVFTPVPENAITPIRQVARLKSLDGKTIALVGGSFMANVTHPELKRLILAEYPNAKVYLLNEIGAAGPYPRQGIVRREKDEFQKKLKEFHVDAVISGNGGCGLCTPKEAGSCIAAEVLSVPAVMIAAPGFVDQAKSTARSHGLQILRVAEYPGAFASHTHDELLKNTRTVLWPQIKKALTSPLSATEKNEANKKTPAVEIFDSQRAIQQAFLEAGWTDGLPIIPPTKEAVAEFLAFTDLSPDASLGAIPPAQREVTVRHVAINGVMAGCSPEFMPILLAWTQAMKVGDFRRTLTSTHAWTPYCWLNGPVARQLDFDCGQGEISATKNAQLGRFINLAMLNLGGYYVKENRMGTFGYLMPWCLVENESATLKIGWKPYHMQQGFQVNESTLTAASSINWGNNLVPATSDGEKTKDMIAWDAVEKSQMAVGSGMPCVYRTFLLTESVAKNLSAVYSSKNALEKALVKTARIPVAQRTFANYWGNPGSAFNPARYSIDRHEERISNNEHASMTSTPPWLMWTGIEQIKTVPAMEEGKSAFIVTGDPARNKEQCVPGGGFATIKIELPKSWNEKMAKLGYNPLESFYLKTTLQPDSLRRIQRTPSHSGNRGDFESSKNRRPFPQQ